MSQKDCSKTIEVQQNSTTLKKSVSEYVNKEAEGDIPCHRIV